MPSHMLTPGATSLGALAAIFDSNAAARLNPACRAAVDHAADMIARAAAGNAPVYGVNTGFGKLASLKIEPRHPRAGQRGRFGRPCPAGAYGGGDDWRG